MLSVMIVFVLYILLIVGGCLQVNPVQRMTVTDVLERLAAIAETKNINLKEPLVLEGKRIDSTSSPGLFIGFQCHSLYFLRLCPVSAAVS
jgi:cyclin G-associated kinase